MFNEFETKLTNESSWGLGIGDWG
ncbi:MAG: hypothetical protein RIR51_1615, partial [Bacteroidota bacterium]